jgi:hypothetical protein
MVIYDFFCHNVATLAHSFPKKKKWKKKKKAFVSVALAFSFLSQGIKYSPKFFINK